MAAVGKSRGATRRRPSSSTSSASSRAPARSSWPCGACSAQVGGLHERGGVADEARPCRLDCVDKDAHLSAFGEERCPRQTVSVRTGTSTPQRAHADTTHTHSQLRHTHTHTHSLTHSLTLVNHAQIHRQRTPVLKERRAAKQLDLARTAEYAAVVHQWGALEQKLVAYARQRAGAAAGMGPGAAAAAAAAGASLQQGQGPGGEPKSRLKGAVAARKKGIGAGGSLSATMGG